MDTGCWMLACAPYRLSRAWQPINVQDGERQQVHQAPSAVVRHWQAAVRSELTSAGIARASQPQVRCFWELAKEMQCRHSSFPRGYFSQPPLSSDVALVRCYRGDTTPSSPSSRLWAAVAGSCVVKGVSLLRSGCCSALTTLNSVSGDVTNRCPEFVVKACLQGRLCDAFTKPPHLFPLEAGSISSFLKKQSQKKTG